MYKKSLNKNKLSIKIALRSLHIYRQLETPQNIEFDIMCTMCDKMGATKTDAQAHPGPTGCHSQKSGGDANQRLPITGLRDQALAVDTR